MRALVRRFGRWLADWRNGATIVAAALVALVAFTVIDASNARNDAVDARNRTSSSATRRIDKLNDKITELGESLASAAYSNGARIGELADQVSALQEQVRQLGGEPVVVDRPRPTSTTRPPPSTTTTSPPPPPTTTTTRPCTVSVAGRCIAP